MAKAQAAFEGIAPQHIANHYDALAQQQRTQQMLPAGSSADGEQAKFITRVQRENGSVVEVLVKYSPPRGTPFGERWHDLLWAEHLSGGVLIEAGIPAANTRVVETPFATYLEGERLDRAGRIGRRHMLPIGSIHEQFVGGSPSHWLASARNLHQQNRLSQADLSRVEVLHYFGKLIGNTDMHAGNLAFFVDTPKAMLQGKFKLAPSYDMLPMRFAPRDGRAWDYESFDASSGIPNIEATPKIRALARSYWARLKDTQAVSRKFRALGGQMLKLI